MLEKEEAKKYLKNNIDNFKNLDFKINFISLEYDNTYLIEIELIDNSLKYVRIPPYEEVQRCIN